MPSKKKKYNARFPAGRIKKIMQSDEEVGKVAQAVPIIISRTLELFVESLLEKTLRITTSRNAKTLSPSHMKQCIMSESRFDFLRELVKNIPDISVVEEAANDNSPGHPVTPTTPQPYDLSMPSTSCGSISDTNGRNGLQFPMRPETFSTNIPMLTQQQTTSNVPASPTADCRKELKRQWDSVHATRQKHIDATTNHAISANFYKENPVIQHTTEATCPKLLRMESSPNSFEDSNLQANPAKRLHQRSKSIPSSDIKVTLASHPPTPAPIVNIDICNRPIVKIDYSNLDLQDKEQIECASVSHQSSSMRMNISPIINIDLSKIATTASSISTNSFFQNLEKTSSQGSLDLDEDYDNI